MVQLPVVPPVDKLPLVARKDIRDNWEANVEEFTQTVAGLLKERYQLEVNFNQLYAHAIVADASWAKSSPGACAKGYFESFIEYLKKFTEDGGYTEAIDAFNDLISTRKVILECDNSVTYSGSSVKSGAFEINYHQNNPGTNVSYACQEFAQAFDDGLRVKDEYALPLMARRAIRDEMEGDKKEELLEKFKSELLGADIKLTADYAGIWKELVDGKKTKDGKDIDLKDYARSFGSYIYSYFNGACYQMEYQFKKDDMVIEAFTDVVKEIVIEVVQETKKGLKNTYSEYEIKDEKLILRTIPRYWGTNTTYVCEKVIDAL